MAEAQTTSRDTVKGGVIAYLALNDAQKAADFYKKALAATEIFVQPPDDKGRTMHIHLHVNGASVMLSDPFPENGCPYVPAAGFTLMLPVCDVDAWWQRAVDAGCKPGMPPEDMFWGDRFGNCTDPFGVSWAFVGPKKAG